jgi:hypothetical protein
VPRSHRYGSKIDKPELSANLQPLRLAYDCLQILSDLGFLTRTASTGNAAMNAVSH